MKKITQFGALLIILFTACNSGSKSGKDKYSAVFKKHEAGISEIRGFLSGLINTLPDAGTNNIIIANPSPALKLGSNDSSGNLLILQYHMLATPEIFTSYDSCFGLYYNPLALDAFKWTGITKDRMIFERDYLKDEEVEKLIAPLNSERFPWLLIVKATNFETLQHNAEGRFSGGSATASSISLTASPDNEMLIAYQARKGEAGKYEEANKKAKETMQKNMRAKVYEWLLTIFNKNASVPAY
jgi:hypothetical protein